MRVGDRVELVPKRQSVSVNDGERSRPRIAHSLRAGVACDYSHEEDDSPIRYAPLTARTRALVPTAHAHCVVAAVVTVPSGSSVFSTSRHANFLPLPRTQ